MGDKVVAKGNAKGKWNKKLYGKPEYSDNYTHESFLQDYKKREFDTSYLQCVGGVLVLTYQISCIVAFLIVFNELHTESMGPLMVLAINVIIIILCYIAYRRGDMWKYIYEDSKTLLAVIVFGFSFAPVLHTLTANISTNTIHYMTLAVMAINLVFYDYGLHIALVSKPVSLSAAIFGAICLASRLKTSVHAFALLVQAAVCFVLAPVFIKESPSFFLLYVFLFAFCSYNLFYLSALFFSLYWIVLSIINFLCPWLFIACHTKKNTNSCPGDEAKAE